MLQRIIKYPNTPVLRPLYDLSGRFGRGFFSIYDRDCGDLVRGLVRRADRGTVLDLGSGFGSDFMLWLRERVGFTGRIISIDADSEVFREKPQYGYERLGDLRICEDAHAISLGDGTVDLVHQQGMFADIEDKINIGQVFNEVSRVLKSGGIYVVNDSVHPLQNENFIQVKADREYHWAAYRKR